MGYPRLLTPGSIGGPTNGRVSAVQRVSKEQKKQLKKVIGKDFNKFKVVPRRTPLTNAGDAAQRIGGLLADAKRAVEYFCVCSWKFADDEMPETHYVVIVDRDIVIDATARRFPKGQKARIVDYTEWFSQLKTRVGESGLAKYVRGSWDACAELGEKLPNWFKKSVGNSWNE